MWAAGLVDQIEPVLVTADGTVTVGCYPENRELSGGMTVVDVPTREAALGWAAKIATACRCPQEVRVVE